MSTNPILIVGAGHAARRAAEALRDRAPDIPVMLVGDELELPYDRPALSKGALMSADGERSAFVRDADWYTARCIDVRLGKHVESIDRHARTVQLCDGSILGYRRLLLATGSRVRRFEGEVAPGVYVHYVRTLADIRMLRPELRRGRRVAVLGGGFIGLEVAAIASQLGCIPTVIDSSSGLLRRNLPEHIGRFAQRLHESHGVTFRFETRPARIVRDCAGDVIIETSQGPLSADVVVAGIGILPNTELAEAAGLEVDNGIRVDAGCRTVDPDIFAAGEVTSHFNPRLGFHTRIESWQVAENQPAVAAANLLGGSETYADIPWLWSDQYTSNLQMLGLFGSETSTIVRGDVDSDSFCVFGLNADSQIVAVAAVNAGREIGPCRRLMMTNHPVDPATLANPAVAMRTLLNR